MNHMYKPLPKELRLGFSDIHDIGLFAKEKIKMGHDFGVCHLKLGKNIFRTPLGGFINHSDTPNCIKTMSLKTVKLPDEKKGPKYVVWNLSTLRDIEPEEDLTLTYTFYKI